MRATLPFRDCRTEAVSYIWHIMIQYTLRCPEGHSFDAWFKNAAAFDEQKGRGLVACAVCGSAEIDKAPMAPAVARTDTERLPVTSAHAEALKLREMYRRYRQKVLAETEYVGDRFAEEARKIHFEEVEARPIHGEATRDEVAGLVEDGVHFMPLPDIGDDN
jgi:Uncharacterized protein conserved in bacteria